jgi:hypothetical protein
MFEGILKDKWGKQGMLGKYIGNGKLGTILYIFGYPWNPYENYLFKKEILVLDAWRWSFSSGD